MTTRKGRKERQSRTPEVTTEEQPKEKEIVKGLYESKWLKLLEKDDVTRYIRNIVEEIFQISLTIIQYKASEEKAYSYSVEWARQLMLETIECYFLTHDPGQPDLNNPLWTGDKEPIPPMIDSWARGVMPMEMSVMTDQECKDMVDSISCGESVTLEGEIPMSPSQQNETPIETNTNTPSPVQRHTNVKRDTRPIARRFRDKDTPIMTVLPQPPFNIDDIDEETITEQWKTESRVSVVRSHTPPSPTAQLAIPPTITTHTDPLPLPHKRSEIVTDSQGKVIYTTHLKSTKFPSKNIRPRVSIPPTSIVSYKHQDNWRLPSKSKQRHRHVHWQQANIPLPKVGQEKGGLKRVESNRFQQKPSLPPLVDLIDPLPGVTIKENERTITGHSSPRSRARSPQHHLKPITPLKMTGNTKDSEDCVNKLTIQQTN